jgi:hypothetical protein
MITSQMAPDKESCCSYSGRDGFGEQGRRGGLARAMKELRAVHIRLTCRDAWPPLMMLMKVDWNSLLP